MDWFYSENGERRGPIPEPTLVELSQGGKIAADTLVWREGWNDWRPFSQSGLTAAGTGSAACVECRKTFPVSEMINYSGSWICPTCKPIFFQRIKEGVVTAATDMTYAGFWIRFLAKFIDGIILQVINFAVSFAFIAVLVGTHNDPQRQAMVGWLNIGISMLIAAAYAIFFVGRFGGTPGKLALRLKVVTASGGTVSYARATGRYFAEFLSSITLAIGYLMAAFDDQKRALHDRICDTRVIRLNA